MLRSHIFRSELTVINEEDESPGHGCEEGDVPGLDDKVVKDLGGPDGPTSSLTSPLFDLILKHTAGSWAGNKRNRNLNKRKDLELNFKNILSRLLIKDNEICGP